MTDITFTFDNSKAAWSFMRAAETAKVSAGFPSLRSPWTVRAAPKTRAERALLEREALRLAGCWHGLDLDYRIGRSPHETRLVDGTGAEVTIVSHDIMSLSERYCGHCHTWVTIEGVFGTLKFMGRHDSGDCVAEGEKTT